MKKFISGIAVGSLLAVGLIFVAQPAQAAINIGVAPSTNGLVMKGEPTQIAVSGIVKAALFVWNTSQKKYFRIGSANPKKALSYTFTNNGIQHIQVRPARGKAKVFRVAVFEQKAAQGSTRASSNDSYAPTAYGSLILPSMNNLGSLNTRSRGWTASSTYDCRFVNIGGKTADGTLSLSIQSTGADPRTVTATKGAPFSKVNVPIKGDVLIEAIYTCPTPVVVGVADVGLVLTCVQPNW